MTPEQAKTKRCCQVDPGRAYTSAVNDAIALRLGRCISAECMAWRWHHTLYDVDGYCGLAGKEGAE